MGPLSAVSADSDSKAGRVAEAATQAILAALKSAEDSAGVESSSATESGDARDADGEGSELPAVVSGADEGQSVPLSAPDSEVAVVGDAATAANEGDTKADSSSSEDADVGEAGLFESGEDSGNAPIPEAQGLKAAVAYASDQSAQPIEQIDQSAQHSNVASGVQDLVRIEATKSGGVRISVGNPNGNKALLPKVVFRNGAAVSLDSNEPAVLLESEAADLEGDGGGATIEESVETALKRAMAEADAAT